MTDHVSWDGVPDETIDFVLSQGEKYLATQVAMSLAADQRATTVASVFAALGAAIFASAIAYWTETGDFPLLFGGLVSGLLAVAGALGCLFAARPINVYAPGAEPRAWYQALTEPLPHSKGVEAENYQAAIDDNDRVMSANSKIFQCSALVAAASPAVGVLTWGITSLTSSQAWTWQGLLCSAAE